MPELKISQISTISNLLLKLRGELLRGSLSSLSLRVLGMLLGYIYSIMIARFFGPSILGDFILAVIILDLLGIINTLGSENAVVALISRYNAGRRTDLANKSLLSAYFIIIVTGIPLTAFSYLFVSAWAGVLFHSKNLSGFLNVMSFSILPLSVTRINAQYMRGLKRIGQFSLFNYFFVYFIGVIVLPILTAAFHSWKTAACCYCFAGLLTCSMSILLITSKYSAIRRADIKELIYSPSGSVLPKLFSLSIPLFFSEFLYFVKIWSGTIIIGLYLNSASTGLFGIISRFASGAGLIMTAVNTAAMPALGEAFGKNDFRSMQHTLTYSAKLIYFSAGLTATLIALLGYSILSWLGRDFLMGYPALLLLCLAQLFEMLPGTAASLLQVSEKQKGYRNIMAADTFSLLIFYFFAIPALGIHGAALAIAFSTLIRSILLVIYTKNILGLRVS